MRELEKRRFYSNALARSPRTPETTHHRENRAISAADVYASTSQETLLNRPLLLVTRVVINSDILNPLRASVQRSRALYEREFRIRGRSELATRKL